MNENPISHDDPRLTAYALDEMTPAERAEFARLLEQDAAARQVVAEIRVAVGSVTAALEHEPVEMPRPAKRGMLLRFPQFYYTVSGLAAACFAMFFIYWQRTHDFTEPKRYIEVPLQPVAVDGQSKDKRAAMEMNEAKAVARAGESSQRQEVDQKVAAMKQVFADSVPAPAPAAVAVPRLEEQVKLEAFQVTGGAVAAPATSQSFGHAGYFGASAEPTWASRNRASYGSVLGVSARGGGNTEAYGFRQDSDYRRVADQPLSTFSIDVDTASYANVRRFLQQGRRPPVDAVRIEELVNYFPYHYAPPTGDAPFAVALESAAAPWNPAHRLVRIGLKGREVTDAQRPPANLVFLLDVSGSMNHPNKLPLVKESLRLLVNKLRPDDRVAIAVYAGASGLALPSTSAAHKAEILDAIDRLEASGSTNGAMGIQLAYDLAKANFVTGGVNRVILATDGDFNVGVTNEGELVRLVQEKAKSGVFLSVLGFGMGNLKDNTLEQLADQGNGNYAYIDSLAEARKTLVEQSGGTLQTIAKDVKLQVEFNPAVVAAYRLIGYENRLLAKEDFNNDKVDAGDIGAGHTVTALYEVVPVGAEIPGAAPAVDGLKYQAVKAPSAKVQTPNNAEMLTVKIRYKEPAGDVSSKLEFPLRDGGAAFASASPDFKFAAAVAAFGMVLRDSPQKGTSTLPDVVAWGREGIADDAGGYRAEFLSLVERAATLQ